MAFGAFWDEVGKCLESRPGIFSFWIRRGLLRQGGPVAGVPTAAALNPWLLFGQKSFDIFALLFCSHRSGKEQE